MRYLLVLFPVLLTAGMAYFYKHDSPRMQKFYRRMTMSRTARELFLRVTLMAMMLFNLLYILGLATDIGVALATTACIVMSSPKRAEQIMFWLQSMRGYAILCTATAACVIVQQLWPLAMNLYIILIASMFYPSEILLKSILDPSKFTKLAASVKAVIKDYYAF